MYKPEIPQTCTHKIHNLPTIYTHCKLQQTTVYGTLNNHVEQHLATPSILFHSRYDLKNTLKLQSWNVKCVDVVISKKTRGPMKT